MIPILLRQTEKSQLNKNVPLPRIRQYSVKGEEVLSIRVGGTQYKGEEVLSIRVRRYSV